MKVSRRIRRLEERVNAMSLRERALVLIGLLGLVFLIVDATLLRPLDERREHIGSQLEQTRDRVQVLSRSIEQIATRTREDPNHELRQRAAALEGRLQRLSAELAGLDTGLMTPAQTLGLMRRVLDEQPQLDLVSLVKLPAEPLHSGDGAEDHRDGGIFVHRFRVEVESGYGGLIDYVQLLENLPLGLYWESLRIEVPDWPANRAELVLYMLTLDEDWLGV